MNWYKKAKLISIPEEQLIPIKTFVTNTFYAFQKEKNNLKTPQTKNAFLSKFYKMFQIQYNNKLININITFCFDFLKPHAYYSRSKNSITLNFNKIKEVYGPDQLNDILNRSIEHEIIHTIQEKAYDNTDNTDNTGGLPKKQLQNKEYNPEGLKTNETGEPISKNRQPHPLRDIEYFPNLNSLFNHIKYKYPNATNQELKQIINRLPILEKIKQKNYEKWKNAVSILYKALQENTQKQYLPTINPSN